VSEHLKTEREIVVYLQDMLADGDPSSVAIALRTVSETIGMTELARRTGLAREALYKILAKDGNPTVKTLAAILGAFNLRIAVARNLAKKAA
jgi:probable addiction module antidote protein